MNEVAWRTVLLICGIVTYVGLLESALIPLAVPFLETGAAMVILARRSRG